MNLTKARVELLQAVADGAVTEYYPLRNGRKYTAWDQGPGMPRPRVTGRIRHIEKLGLVQLAPSVAAWSFFAPRAWQLTNKGRAALEANGGKP